MSSLALVRRNRLLRYYFRTNFTYLFLYKDLVNEVVNLESTDKTTVHTLSSRVPDDHGRYHLFRFPHTHEGDFLESTGWFF